MLICVVVSVVVQRDIKLWKCNFTYLSVVNEIICSPFYSSLPIENLGQSSLCVNQVAFFILF